MKIAPAFLQTFGSQILQSAASITTGVVIARGLGPAGQGQYAFLAALVAFAVIPLSLGQFEGNVLLAAGRVQTGRVLLLRSALHAFIVAAVVAATLPFWGRPLERASLGGVALWFGAVLTLEVQAQLLRGINLGQHHITAYNVATLLQRVVLLAGVAVLSIVGLRLEAVFLAWAVASALSMLASAAWIWARSPSVPLGTRALLRGWDASVRQGLRALVTISFALLLVRCDIWMLGTMLGMEVAGQMSIASSLAEWLWYVPSILGNVLFAAVAADRGPETVAKIGRAARSVITLVLPVAAALIATGRELVPWIYGPAYRPAGLLFVVLLPGTAAIAVHLVVDTYFTGSGFPPVSIWSAICALVAKVGLNFVAIPEFGAMGAAVATVFVYAGLLGTKVVWFRRATGVPIKKLLMPTREETLANAAAARAWLAGRARSAGPLQHG